MKNLLLPFVMLFGFFFILSPASAEYLTGSGCSVSNRGYLNELAKEYEKRTGVKVYIRGGGSLVGIEDLHSGRVDFAASCRGRETGDPRDVQFIQVAWDALAIIVHRSNPVDSITLEDARSIYLGWITNWRQLHGIDSPVKVFISRPRKGLSGVEASLRALILGGRDSVTTPNTFFVASTGIVEQMVEGTPGGFATTGFSSAQKRNVKMLKVSEIYPTRKNIISDKYRLKRPLFLLIPANPRPEVRKFVDFVLSKEGQKFISSQGVVSLRDVR
jgi:phosphate transport system substrate-binding protein